MIMSILLLKEISNRKEDKKTLKYWNILGKELHLVVEISLNRRDLKYSEIICFLFEIMQSLSTIKNNNFKIFTKLPLVLTYFDKHYILNYLSENKTLGNEVKAMVFPVVMYGCESWTIQKAEHGRIDAFELWCWRRLLRVLWTARRSNQSILKEISPEYSMKGLMLKLKLQFFGHLTWRADSFEKTLMLGIIEGRRRRGR